MTKVDFLVTWCHNPAATMQIGPRMQFISYVTQINIKLWTRVFFTGASGCRHLCYITVECTVCTVCLSNRGDTEDTRPPPINIIYSCITHNYIIIFALEILFPQYWLPCYATAVSSFLSPVLQTTSALQLLNTASAMPKRSRKHDRKYLYKLRRALRARTKNYTNTTLHSETP